MAGGGDRAGRRPRYRCISGRLGISVIVPDAPSARCTGDQQGKQGQRRDGARNANGFHHGAGYATSAANGTKDWDRDDHADAYSTRRSRPSTTSSAPELDDITIERAVIGLFFTGVKLSTGQAGACVDADQDDPRGGLLPLVGDGDAVPRQDAGPPARDVAEGGVLRATASAAASASLQSTRSPNLCARRRPHPLVELRRGVDAFDANSFAPDDLTVVVGAFVPFLKELKRHGQKFLVLEKDPDTLKAEEMPFYRPAEWRRRWCRRPMCC